MAFSWADDIKSVAVTQDSISLQQPDPEDQRDFLVEEKLGKTDPPC